jgi:Protease subunit of ATP-dependent Clp proteases
MPIRVINENTLLLYGGVSYSDRDEKGDWFSSFELVETLAKFRNKDIVVRINSPGGSYEDSLVCYDALKNHSGNVDVIVEGICASAGSHIPMAGRTVRIAPNAFMMIHDVSSPLYGNADKHRKIAQQLDVLSDGMAAAYAAKTGKPAALLRELMKAETWYTAEEAIAFGLADEMASANDNAEPAPFPYRSYARAPERIVALADARGWNARSIDRAGVPAPDKEPSMTGQKPTGAPPVDQRARMKAILTADEAKGREGLAEYMAFETDDPPEKVLAILAAAPTTTAVQEDTPETYSARRIAAGATVTAGLARPGAAPATGPRKPPRWSDITRNEERQA